MKWCKLSFNHLKSGKAVGPSSIVVEMLKAASYSIVENIYSGNKFDDKNQREKHYCYYIIQIYLKRFDAHTAVFRKDTNTDIYLHWDSFSPVSWKKGTLKVLIARAFLVCSTDYFLQTCVRINSIIFIQRLFSCKRGSSFS